MESTEIEKPTEDKLSLVPMQSLQLADLETYEGWVKTETKELIEAVKKSITELKDNEGMIALIDNAKLLKGKSLIVKEQWKNNIHKERLERKQASDKFRKTVIDPLEDLIDNARDAVTNFRIEQERKRDEEEEAKRAEVKRREEAAAKAKAEYEADVQRKKDEHARQVREQELNHAYAEALQYDEWWTKEKERKAKIEQDRLAKEKREEEARLNRAVAAVDNGDAERAEKIVAQPTALEAPIPEPAPIPKPKPLPEPAPIPKPVIEAPPEPIPAPLPEPATPEAPKVEGVTPKQYWRARIVKPMEVFRAVLDGITPIETENHKVIEINLPYYNKMAIKLKDKEKFAERCPGAEAYIVASTDIAAKMEGDDD